MPSHTIYIQLYQGTWHVIHLYICVNSILAISRALSRSVRDVSFTSEISAVHSSEQKQVPNLPSQIEMASVKNGWIHEKAGQVETCRVKGRLRVLWSRGAAARSMTRMCRNYHPRKLHTSDIRGQLSHARYMSLHPQRVFSSLQSYLYPTISSCPFFSLLLCVYACQSLAIPLTADLPRLYCALE